MEELKIYKHIMWLPTDRHACTMYKNQQVMDKWSIRIYHVSLMIHEWLIRLNSNVTFGEDIGQLKTALWFICLQSGQKNIPGWSIIEYHKNTHMFRDVKPEICWKDRKSTVHWKKMTENSVLSVSLQIVNSILLWMKMSLQKNNLSSQYHAWQKGIRCSPADLNIR